MRTNTSEICPTDPRTAPYGGWLRPHLDSPHGQLVAHFRSIADALPDRMGVTHLDRGEEEAGSMTFGEMDRLARSLAAHLQHARGAGERGVMIFEPGLELVYSFLGCLYAQVIAVPMPAPLPGRVDRYLHRVTRVVADSDIH